MVLCWHNFLTCITYARRLVIERCFLTSVTKTRLECRTTCRCSPLQSAFQVRHGRYQNASYLTTTASTGDFLALNTWSMPSTTIEPLFELAVNIEKPMNLLFANSVPQKQRCGLQQVGTRKKKERIAVYRGTCPVYMSRRYKHNRQRGANHMLAATHSREPGFCVSCLAVLIRRQHCHQVLTD
jgi:hypothetical protein